MPRKRKAGRGFYAPPEATVAAIRKRFEDSAELAWLRIKGDFRTRLPTPAERWAFQQAFPAEFFGMFGFFAGPTDDYPASTVYHFRVFLRPQDEFLAMIEGRKLEPFEAPNVSGLHFYPERFEAMALARGQWWRANGLPMTAAERSWLASRQQ